MTTSKATVDEDSAREELGKAEAKAREFLKDKETTTAMLGEATKKAKSAKNQLSEVWEMLQLMFKVLGDYLSGEYKTIPVGSIVAIVAALLYFLSPIDLIPDFIPIIGYIDDVMVIGLVINQISKDLEKYKIWMSRHK